jgi:hypothetical protein
MDAFRYAVEERGDDDEEEREEEKGEEEEEEDDDDDDEEDQEGIAVGVDGNNAEPMPRMMAGRPVRVPPGPVRGALHEMMMEAGHPRGMQQWLLDSDDDEGDDNDDDEIRRSLGLGVERLRRLQRVAGGGNADGGGGEEEDVSGPWVVNIKSESFEWAVADLEALAAEDEIEDLVVATLASRDEWSEQEVANHAHHFQRFVERLDQQQPGRVIRSIKFEDVSFDLEDALIRPHDVDRLFGSTLPLHPTLEKIEFKNCHISEASMELFTSSLPAVAAASATTADDHPQHHNRRTTALIPKELVLRLGGMNADAHVRSVAAMVRRNARVARLTVSADFTVCNPTSSDWCAADSKATRSSEPSR